MHTADKEIETWDIELGPKKFGFRVGLGEVWQYRDLLMMFVKRDVISVYKQTILGPLWFFVQPILTTLMFVIVFGNIANLSTGRAPAVLFYLAGVTIWNYFSETLTTTSNTFVANANIFGKVYFPRLVLPTSKVISGLVKLGIQFLLFLLVFIYYFMTDEHVNPSWLKILYVTPIAVLLMGGLGLGFGLILSSLTTKYRDLSFLVSFGVQLLMYATPVIYPLSAISDNKYEILIKANPLTSIVEAFRSVYLGAGELSWDGLLYTTIFTIVVVVVGSVIFNSVEKNFMDTV